MDESVKTENEKKDNSTPLQATFPLAEVNNLHRDRVRHTTPAAKASHCSII